MFKKALLLLLLLGTVYVPLVSSKRDWVILEITARTSKAPVEGLPIVLWVEGYEYSGLTDENGQVTIPLKGHLK